MKIGFHLHHIDNKLKFAFLIIFLCFNTFVFSQADKARKTTQKFSTTLQLIEFGYVDSIDSPDLVEKAIIAMLKELDPHSAYIKAEDVKRLNEPLEAEFDGIGVTFQLFNDTILVIAPPVPGGPSDKLGILAGDKIIKINGEDAFGKKINNEYVMKLLRGKKGTSVDVSILRSGKDELIDFTIVRDKIPINSIDATYMAAPEIGYIKLTRFAKSSVQEFNESLSRLRAQGMKDLILDLRGNTGGYLNIAVDLADQFLSDKKNDRLHRRASFAKARVFLHRLRRFSERKAYSTYQRKLGLSKRNCFRRCSRLGQRIGCWPALIW